MLLVKIKRDLENHVRGLLKNLGLVIGRAKFNVFAVRAEELIESRPELIVAIRPLLEARNAVGQQVSECPSADKLRLVRRFEKGGSGSSGLEFKRPAADAASGGLRLLYA